MTTAPGTEPGHESDLGPEQSEQEQRPALHVVRADEPASGPESEPDSADVDDGIAPEAPWQYRIGEQIATLSDALPGLWANRRPSYAERVQYALYGDWTTAAEGQSTTRTLHLLGVLACLAVKGLVVTPLDAATDKPSRLGLLALALLILAYAV